MYYLKVYIFTKVLLFLKSKIYIPVFLKTGIYIYIHTYIHACMHACMHAYIHTYIHTYIHAYMHTYIYVSGPLDNESRNIEVTLPPRYCKIENRVSRGPNSKMISLKDLAYHASGNVL